MAGGPLARHACAEHELLKHNFLDNLASPLFPQSLSDGPHHEQRRLRVLISVSPNREISRLSRRTTSVSPNGVKEIGGEAIGKVNIPVPAIKLRLAARQRTREGDVLRFGKEGIRGHVVFLDWRGVFQILICIGPKTRPTLDLPITGSTFTVESRQYD